MTAKRIQGADLREKNRTPLQDAVPLDTPMLLYLEPSNACQIHCAFCPTDDAALIKSVGRPRGLMSWRLFAKIVDDLKQFPRRIKMINFFKDGEPLTNPHYADMAAYLRGSNVAEQIWTKTNGLLLTPELNKLLCGYAFDMIGVSVIAPHAEGYKRVAGVTVDYDRFVGNVGDLYSRRAGTRIYIKMADAGFAPDEIAKFYHDFEDKCDFIAVENLHGWSRTELKDFTLGTRPDTFDGVPNKNKTVCPWTLYQLTVNWNGKVQLCNEDWSWQNIVGDTWRDSLLDIWHGDTVYQFRKLHLEGKRFDNAACGTCWQTMSQLDDVDKYRGAILERLTREREERVQSVLGGDNV